MVKPLLSTFCACTEWAEAAIKAGADHLILEDSKCSIRSYSHDFNTPDFKNVSKMAEKARAINPEILLSFNIDILAHQYHIETIQQLLITLKESNIQTIRLQDPGLVFLVRTIIPDAVFHLSTETGNLNRQSILFHTAQFQRQCLSNELPIKELRDISSSINTELEIQVHGPILIQYSKRRFMSHYLNNKDTQSSVCIRKKAVDHEFKNRTFQFYDNPHGHFMFLHVDRCLIRHVPELVELDLTSLLIDARGESIQYLTQTLMSYRNERNDYMSNPESYQLKNQVSLDEISPRPLKAGFFKINNTDKDWRNLHPTRSIPHEIIGTVIDVVKNNWLTIELNTDLKIGENYTLLSPERKQRNVQLDCLLDAWGKPIQKGKEHQLVKIKWVKGIVPQSIIF
ncbi:MAG: U32 family peptidase [Candidatus Margulisbacteria bacterium]|nr:U32 family peptidase [Candidatus Margulisiibacteriota bacterium]